VVDRRRSGDGERLYLEIAPGRVVPVPGAWTSLGPADAWLEVAGGRALFRVDDLLRLADLMASVGAGGPDGV
jgi:hypothetical protein